MTKLIRHDFGGIRDALNKMIIEEVKAALRQLPDQEIRAKDGFPLCRIVVSGVDDYRPQSVDVDGAWLFDKDGKLCVSGKGQGLLFTEDDTGWLNITDFGYLIDQIAEQVSGDKTANLPTLAAQNCDTAPEYELTTSVWKTI